MGAFIYWLTAIPFLICLVIWDMYQATKGNSKMDKFKKSLNK